MHIYHIYNITSNLNYLKCGTDLVLKEWKSERWRTYWIYIFIRQLNRWNQKGRDIMFDFHGKFVKGQEKIAKIQSGVNKYESALDKISGLEIYRMNVDQVIQNAYSEIPETIRELGIESSLDI